MPDTETELNSSEMAQEVQSELMDMIISDESPANIVIRLKIFYLQNQQIR